VTELRLHGELYAGTAVDAAMKVYAPYATFDRVAQAPYWVVQITARSPERERRVAGELANYALGLTVKERRR
jgi:hypothetical protein